MAAELGEEFGHGFQGVEQMELRDAAARALGDAVLNAEHERRTMEAFDDTARHDADDPAMPVFAGENQGGFGVGDGCIGAELGDGLRDFEFGFLTVFVQVVELRGEGAGAFGIVGEEHLDHIRGAGHASGGIDPWGNAEGNLAGAGRGFADGESRDIEQGAQTGIANFLKSIETALDDHAILAGERHDIRDGRDGDDLEERIEQTFALGVGPCKLCNQRVDQLEGYAGSAEVFLWIGAVGDGSD